MSMLKEIRALLSDAGLSKRELLRELIIDAVTEDEEDIARCTIGCSMRCTSCSPGCSNGGTAK
ncbi:UNVERIFIED_CONTAM: hypothetical protein ABIC26_001943 [Paenibacillus sp. PvR008]